MRRKPGVDIQGDKALRKLMKKLPDKTLRKVARQSINAAATPVLKAARRNAPSDSGKLKSVLAKKVKTYTKSKAVIALVGPKSREATHAHFVEKGTAPRTQKTTGRYLGRTPATRFLQRALDENRSASLAKLRAKMGQAIEREAAKLGRGRR